MLQYSLKLFSISPFINESELLHFKIIFYIKIEIHSNFIRRVGFVLFIKMIFFRRS